MYSLYVLLDWLFNVVARQRFGDLLFAGNTAARADYQRNNVDPYVCQGVAHILIAVCHGEIVLGDFGFKQILDVSKCALILLTGGRLIKMNLLVYNQIIFPQQAQRTVHRETCFTNAVSIGGNGDVVCRTQISFLQDCSIKNGALKIAMVECGTTEIALTKIDFL